MASRKANAKKAIKAIKKAPKGVVVFVMILLFVAVAGYYVYINYFKEDEPGLVAVGDISFHFLELGNDKAGDCIYVKAGENDIIIDAGSEESSVSTIKAYVDKYVTDGKIEYAIITHAHKDHFACFAGNGTYKSLFTYYEFETIIDFPKTDSASAIYNRYITERDKEIELGATHYTALDCYYEVKGAKREYGLSESTSFEILYNYYYENPASDENDYSVCVQFKHGDRKFLFTGDLEEKGEEKLVQNNNLGQVELYKAGHHGSAGSSSKNFIDVIKPKICVIPCVCGSAQYGSIENKTNFPTQKMIDNISKWTTKVYVTSMVTKLVKDDKNEWKNDGFTSMNGDVVVISKESGVQVECSNNNTLLKDTEWFKQNRSSIYWN